MKKDIKEVVESYGVKLWAIGEDIYRGACPMHTNLNTPSFTVYTATQSYFCFGESIGGDTANFISHMEGEVSFQEDFNMMMDSASVVDTADYAAQLNFSVSKYCRDLLLEGVPSSTILLFLQHVDKDILSKPVTRDILESVIVQSRQLRGDPK
jgi:hypothetical protein